MKLTEEQKTICNVFKQMRYGKVRCAECPMVLNSRYCVCLKTVSKGEAINTWDWDGNPYPALKRMGGNNMADSIDKQTIGERIDRIFQDLSIECAYDMPSFWYNNGKDYKVIPTKYHKGYQKALEDAEKRIMDALKEVGDG